MLRVWTIHQNLATCFLVDLPFIKIGSNLKPKEVIGKPNAKNYQRWALTNPPIPPFSDFNFSMRAVSSQLQPRQCYHFHKALSLLWGTKENWVREGIIFFFSHSWVFWGILSFFCVPHRACVQSLPHAAACTVLIFSKWSLMIEAAAWRQICFVGHGKLAEQSASSQGEGGEGSRQQIIALSPGADCTVWTSRPSQPRSAKPLRSLHKCRANLGHLMITEVRNSLR